MNQTGISRAKQTLRSHLASKGFRLTDWSTGTSADEKGLLIAVCYVGTSQEQFEKLHTQIPEKFEGFRIVVHNVGPATAEVGK